MEHFEFKGFNPVSTLKLKAERAFMRVIERAPSDARITAVLEKDGDIFHCSIEIGSSSYPLSVECSHKNASIALDKAELATLRKLDRWSGTKFNKMEHAPLRAPLRAAQ